MATYTTGVDPNSFQTTGYQLPVNQILQAVATRNQYWDAGASALKNAYTRNLNLNLTLDQNKQQLQGLMKGVDQGLRQAVRADLSIAPNVSDAAKIFDPILKNENIQGDNAITTHYQKELSLADAYRTKDGGKEYSPTNVQDLMIGLDKFAKSGDPSKWKEHYAQMRNYTPYHDVQSEINELRKTFKPDITTSTLPGVDPKTGQPNGFYLKTVTDKSSYENQWKAYLGANLSDKARQQLAINGRVAYYNNPETLVRDYADYTGQKIANTVKEKNVTTGIMKALPVGQLKDLYKQKIADLEDNIKDLGQEKGRLDAGDLSTIKNNQDQVAALVYSDNYISNVARSLQHIDTEVSFKPDSVAVNFFNQQLENNRFGRSLELKKAIAEADLKFKYTELAVKTDAKKKEELLEWNASTINSDETNDKTFTQDLYDKQVENNKQGLDQASGVLFDFMKAMGNDVGTMNADERKGFLNTWVTQGNNKNSREYQNYKQAFDLYNNQKTVRDQVVAEATDRAKQKYPEVFKDTEQLIPTGTFTGTDVAGVTKEIPVTGEQLKGFYLGTDNSITVKKDPLSGDKTYYITDKAGDQYRMNNRSAELLTIAGARLHQKYGNTGDKIKEMIEEHITQSFSVQKPAGDQYKSPQAIAMRQGFVREFGLLKSALDDITVYGRNQLGTYFNVPSSLDAEHLGVEPKQLVNMVTQRGGKVVTVNGNPLYFVPYTAQTGGTGDIYVNPQLRPLQDYFDQHKAQSANTTVSAPAGVNYDPNNIGEAFTFMMKNIGGVATYHPIYKNEKLDLGPEQGFESLEAADLYLKGLFKNKAAFDANIQYYR